MGLSLAFGSQHLHCSFGVFFHFVIANVLFFALLRSAYCILESYP